MEIPEPPHEVPGDSFGGIRAMLQDKYDTAQYYMKDAEEKPGDPEALDHAQFFVYSYLRALEQCQDPKYRELRYLRMLELRLAHERVHCRTKESYVLALQNVLDKGLPESFSMVTLDKIVELLELSKDLDWTDPEQTKKLREKRDIEVMEHYSSIRRALEPS